MLTMMIILKLKRFNCKRGLTKAHFYVIININ
nr:MAG TPA: hypothetical protein [Caudoviricetes sp.]